MNPSEYAFADRGHEQRRLASQAELFGPLTERVFREAGVGAGMRVLDLGSGAGDVAMLAARLVGPEGEVVGIERDPEAVASATARVAQAGFSNIRFVQGDVQALQGIAGGFDAAVGRLVLMYLPDPAAALRRVVELVQPGGLVCIQEGDMAYDWAAPMTPLWVQIRAWFLTTLERAKASARMGLSLYATYVAAGLPGPELRLECALGGGDMAWAWANVMRGVLPLMERLGVTTAAELAAETLADRLQDELRAAKGVVISPPLIAAWARRPASS
ncbi:MAG: class I SAM-dependent methyltransferase [Hyphomicrobiales bacterium]|nr:class I SAM-dependent methyltransferase [Hyphomicrobiales bacterium]